jgi:hypothetical protein
LAEKYVWETPPSTDLITRLGVETATPPDVTDANRADVSMDLVALAVELRLPHSSPFEEVLIWTMVMHPGFSTYVGSDPLRVHAPPGRPSVYDTKPAA